MVTIENEVAAAIVVGIGLIIGMSNAITWLIAKGRYSQMRTTPLTDAEVELEKARLEAAIEKAKIATW